MPKKKRSALGKFALGLASIGPLLVIVLMFGLIFSNVRSTTIPIVQIVMAIGAVSAVVFTATLGYYLYLINVDVALDSSAKTRWSLIMLFFLPFGAIAFWYRFIWQDRGLNSTGGGQ